MRCSCHSNIVIIVYYSPTVRINCTDLLVVSGTDDVLSIFDFMHGNSIKGAASA